MHGVDLYIMVTEVIHEVISNRCLVPRRTVIVWYGTHIISFGQWALRPPLLGDSMVWDTFCRLLGCIAVGRGALAKAMQVLEPALTVATSSCVVSLLGGAVIVSPSLPHQ